MVKTSQAEQEEIGTFYLEALEVFGSNEELFEQYPDAAGLLFALRIASVREAMREQLRFVRKTG